MSSHEPDHVQDAGAAGRRLVRPLDPHDDPVHFRQQFPRRIQQLKGNSHHPPRVLVLGGHGANAQARVLPTLKVHAAQGRCHVIVADRNPDVLHGPPARGVHYVQVGDDDQIQQLMGSCQIAVIQVWPQLHPRFVRLAIEAKVPVIIAEKPPSDTLPHCIGLADDVLRAYPQSLVGFSDHYLGLNLIELATHLVRKAAGNDLASPAVSQFCFVLREKAAIEPQQTISQAQGAKEPGFHGVTLMDLFCGGLHDWRVGCCWNAVCPESPIDAPTYAAWSFYRPTTRQTAHTIVAKYQETDEKAAYLTLRDGRRMIVDRLTSTVRLGREAHGCRADSGYERIFHGLFDPAEPPPPLLTVHQSLEALRLCEDACRGATALPTYPRGTWVAPGFGAIARSRAAARRRRLPNVPHATPWPTRLPPMHDSGIPAKGRPAAD